MGKALGLAVLGKCDLAGIGCRGGCGGCRPGAPEARGPQALPGGVPHPMPDLSVRWILDRGFPVAGKAGSQAEWLGWPRTLPNASAWRRSCCRRRRWSSSAARRRHRPRLQQPAHDYLGLREHAAGQGEPPAGLTRGLKRVFTASRQATGLVRQLLLFSRKRPRSARSST